MSLILYHTHIMFLACVELPTLLFRVLHHIFQEKLCVPWGFNVIYSCTQISLLWKPEEPSQYYYVGDA